MPSDLKKFLKAELFVPILIGAGVATFLMSLVWDWVTTPYFARYQTDVPLGSMIYGSEWVDNEFLMFKGYDFPNVKEPGDYSLFRWRVGEEPRPFAKSYSANFFCAVNGEPVYHAQTVERDGSVFDRYIIGWPGESRILDKKLGSRKGVTHSMWATRATLDCLDSVSIRPEMDGYYWKPLLRGHGYLVYGKEPDDNVPSPLRYYSEDGALLLETFEHKWNFKFFNYSPVRGAYLFRPNYTYDRGDACFPYYFLWPEGKLEKGCIPGGKWTGADVELVALKEGLFLSTMQTGTQGGYLYRDGKLQKIFKGFAENLAVSPDGCKLAFSYARISTDPLYYIFGGRRRMTVLDFCDG